MTGDRQYHIGLAPGEVAPWILLAGDPARARRAAEQFESVEGEWSHREYVTITGQWQGHRVSVMATGIGCDNVEIAVIELCAVVDSPTLIRIGTCGALQPEIALGDLVVTWGAVRLENTSLQFVPEGYPAISHPHVARALEEAAAELGHPYHCGLTATASGFYGAQGRDIPGFPTLQPDLPDRLAALGVKNMEMEASTLLTLASLRGLRAGVVCTAFAQRSHGNFVDDDAQKVEFQDRVIACGLEGIRRLAKADGS